MDEKPIEFADLLPLRKALGEAAGGVWLSRIKTVDDMVRAVQACIEAKQAAKQRAEEYKAALDMVQASTGHITASQTSQVNRICANTPYMMIPQNPKTVDDAITALKQVSGVVRRVSDENEANKRKIKHTENLLANAGELFGTITQLAADRQQAREEGQ